MKRGLKVVSLTGLIMAILGFSSLASATDYPTKVIELIVPVTAGGSMSMGSRIVAQGLSEILGKPVIIINKPGAGTTIGAGYAAKAKPDGYTLFTFNSASNGVAPAIRSNIGYKNTDFELLGQFAAQDLAIASKLDAPWKTTKDLAEYAKKNPGGLKCGTIGAGTSSHFVLELFNSEAGKLKIDSVPFKGDAEMMHALLGGHIHLAATYSVAMKGLYDAGKIRIFGVCSGERASDFPDVPTLKEQGFQKVILQTWYGIAAPVGVPGEILNKLRMSFAKVVQTPETMSMLKHIGFSPVYRDSENFTKFVRDTEEMYFRVAKEAGIKVD